MVTNTKLNDTYEALNQNVQEMKKSMDECMAQMQATIENLLALVFWDTSATLQHHHNENEEIDYEDEFSLEEHSKNVEVQGVVTLTEAVEAKVEEKDPN